MEESLSRPMRIVAFGSYDVRAHPRVQVLIEGLRALGHDVVEVNAPLGAGTAARVRAVRSRAAAATILLRVLRAWMLLLKRWRDCPGPVDAVLVGYLGHFDVHLARWLAPRTPRALDLLVLGSDTVSDRRLASEGGFVHGMLGRLDSAAVGAADVIVADTAESAERIALATGTSRERIVVCPVGAEESWFAAGQGRLPRTGGSPLRVCFFGTYSPLQGAPTIAGAATRLEGADIRFTMIGDGQDRPAAQRLAAGANVRWIDWLDSAALREEVVSHDVCLGIFGDTDKAARVVPTKMYQGAAAGCAIVSRESPATRAAFGDAVLTVPPGDSRALAEALRSLADRPDRLRDAQAAASARALACFTPAAVAAPLARALEARRGGGSP